MRITVTAPDDYYDKVFHSQDIPALGPNEPHPRFFPYPTKFQEYLAEPGQKPDAVVGARPEPTESQYIEPLRGDSTNITFLAKVKSSDRNLVIKFVDRYGVRAHQLLADEKMAPQLLYCGPLDGMNDVRIDGSCAEGSTKTGGLYVGPMRMIVMEYVETDTVEPIWPDDARKKVEEAIKKLHDAGFVFGDLRAIIHSRRSFSGRKFQLVDAIEGMVWVHPTDPTIVQAPQNLMGAPQHPLLDPRRNVHPV